MATNKRDYLLYIRDEYIFKREVTHHTLTYMRYIQDKSKSYAYIQRKSVCVRLHWTIASFQNPFIFVYSKCSPHTHKNRFNKWCGQHRHIYSRRNSTQDLCGKQICFSEYQSLYKHRVRWAVGAYVRRCVCVELNGFSICYMHICLYALTDFWLKSDLKRMGIFWEKCARPSNGAQQF